MTACFADTYFFIAFVIMQDHDLRDALTGDHHFEQAGFNVLMK